MNPSALFIHRPIATTLLAIGLAIAGLIAFNFLPVSPLPQIEFPTISVQASLPGASPETMATSVATPLERQLGRIAGITQMTSSSSLGSTNIVIQFVLDRDINGAARDVQAAINAASGQLPSNLPSNPTYKKVNPADSPILIIALTSDTYTAGQLYDAASTILQQRLAQVDGIGQVNVGGSSLPAVRVELNPTALNKYGIGLLDIKTAITAANSNSPTGQLVNGDKMSEINTRSQLSKAVQYQPLIITYRNGNPVRLKDVAEVKDSVQDVRNAGLANGKPAVMLVLFKEPGANVIKTVERVRALLPYLKESIPAAIDMTIVMDRTTTIRASLHDVEITLLIAVLLVIFVIYLFLRDIRAMMIPSIAMSLSLIGTFGIMYLLGYSLNNLSLMALTIATGFVVDDAIVVLENTSRHIENGMPPKEAATQGSSEVGFTVMSMSLSLIAVFIPILLMSDLLGRLFREFAVTLSVAILVSLAISLTVTPMMCAQFLKSKGTPKGSSIHSTISSHYARGLRWALQHSRLMLLLTLAAILLNIYLFIVIPKGFFPQQDTGRIMASLQTDQNISFQALKGKFSTFVNRIKEDPAVANVVGFVGSGPNSGFMFISLKPLAERAASADAVIARLRKKLSDITGAVLYMQSAQDLVIGGRQGNAQFQYTLSADTLEDLNIWAPKIMARLSKLPGIADVNSDQRNNGLQVFVTIDRATAARFGISSSQINSTMYAAFGQSPVSTIYADKNQYYVVMEAAPPYLQRPESLKDIYVTSPTGEPVPLSAITSYAPSSTLLSVNHQGQAPSATLSFNLLPGFALGDAVNVVGEAVKKMHLPVTLTGTFQGTAQAFQRSLSNMPLLILAALFAVYIVLGMLYESLIHPVTILSTLPSAGVGALLALLLTNTELSIIALIGILLLIGIVKKNAIMMIDFALHMQRTEKKPPEEAIYQAAILRFRPIMMTTMAALFGAVPLALGLGEGAELRQPLGIAIIGGLIVSQMLTLFTVPVIYLSMERWSKK